MKDRCYIFLIMVAIIQGSSCKQSAENTSKASDGGGITYTNPVLHADYSDPDVIRVGGDYYMVASSFNCVPGIPVLHSHDLVNWKLSGYALPKLVPEDHYNIPRHGGGVWAPCIRYHDGEFYIYYPDPDFGIYMIKSKDPLGQWSDPVIVLKGTGLIDPSPLWDDDGKVYLVYAFAGSRAGVKSVLMLTRLSSDGTRQEGGSVMIFDGHDENPTVEGPKFYKRNGYYYIFAPAGGVTFGWQLVLRSENIFGPYEVRKVMHQGNTLINGPHQGAWVTTPEGEDWFIHFQDKGAYGRIVHLQPLKWVEDWPVTGVDNDSDGVGEPVSTHSGPGTGTASGGNDLPGSDEFNGYQQGLQWQWHANPSMKWGYMSGNLGFFRLNCTPKPDGFHNLWDVAALMLQKLPAEDFTATASLTFNARYDGEEAGLLIMGRSYQYISLFKNKDKTFLRIVRCNEADKGSPEETTEVKEIERAQVYLRVRVEKEAVCSFSYSINGSEFTDMGESFRAAAGMWIGAKIGFFALREGFINDSGSADIDWFRVERND